MDSNKNISKGSEIDNQIYLMQEVKTNYFLKLFAQEGSYQNFY